MSDQPQQAGKYYQIGRVRLERQPDGLWGASDGSRGVGGYPTPQGAYLALRRWQRDLNPWSSYCGACLRFRYSPIHGLARGLGFCPGDKRSDQ